MMTKFHKYQQMGITRKSRNLLIMTKILLRGSQITQNRVDLILAINPLKWMTHYHLSQQHPEGGDPLEAYAGKGQEQKQRVDYEKRACQRKRTDQWKRTGQWKSTGQGKKRNNKVETAYVDKKYDYCLPRICHMDCGSRSELKCEKCDLHLCLSRDKNCFNFFY